MNTKEKMTAIKKMMKITGVKEKISKKELIDKVYADLEARTNAEESEISAEDMKILEQYANNQQSTAQQPKNAEQLSEEAKQALKDYFSQNE